jgi:hypothetical protein
VDQRVHIGAQDHAARIALAQYIARPPLALAKLTYLPDEATVRYHSAFNPAIGDSLKVWRARDFIPDATLFIPPQGVRLIHYYGLYASRSRRCGCPPEGRKWPQWDHVARHTPRGWKQAHGVNDTEPSPQPFSPSAPQSSCRSAWARLIAKVYEIDPLGRQQGAQHTAGVPWSVPAVLPACVFLPSSPTRPKWTRSSAIW